MRILDSMSLKSTNSTIILEFYFKRKIQTWTGIVISQGTNNKIVFTYQFGNLRLFFYMQPSLVMGVLHSREPEKTMD